MYWIGSTPPSTVIQRESSGRLPPRHTVCSGSGLVEIDGWFSTLILTVGEATSLQTVSLKSIEENEITQK